MVPIKSMYFEIGSKGFGPGEKYNSFYGKFSVLKWLYFSLFWQYSYKGLF